MWETLEHNEERLMNQGTTMFRVGTCKYELQYTVKEKYRILYFKQRNIFLCALSPDGYDPFSIQKLPEDNYVWRENYIEFGIQIHGSFGWISQVVNITTGDPIVIKEFCIKYTWEHDKTLAKADMERYFVVSQVRKQNSDIWYILQEKRDLLSVLDIWYEYNHSKDCYIFEKFYIFMFYICFYFFVRLWNDLAIPQKTKLYWLREMLEGLNILYIMRIIYCNIKLQNILIMSIVLFQTSIYDYSKAIQENHSTVIIIGLIYMLASEIWTVSDISPCTKKIDIWVYDYVIAELLGYSIRKYSSSNDNDNYRITLNRYLTIFNILHDHYNKISENESLVDLTLKLFAWKPEEH